VLGVRGVPAPTRRVVAAAPAALVLGALILAGPRAGAGARTASVAPPPAERVVAGMLGGVPLQRASCADWQAAGPAQRRAVVASLRATVGGASSTGGVGTTLPDERAMATLSRICGTPSTGGFVLYLLYARAAAFSRVAVGV
jgi:hypothetical protein